MIRPAFPAPAVEEPRAAAAGAHRPAEARRDFERLRVTTHAGGIGFDLLSADGGGPAVATVRPAAHVVILDAILRRDDRGVEEVVTSEFDVALQRGRVVRWSLDGPGGPDSLPLFEGPPGSVLWWLRDQDGRLEVRDVRHGCTHRVAQAEDAGEPAGRRAARRPA